MTDARPILWTPSPERAEASTMAAFIRCLSDTRGLTFNDYPALWQWSVTDLEGFWSAIWDFFDLEASKPPETILAERKMPGAEWFPGAQIGRAHV